MKYDALIADFKNGHDLVELLKCTLIVVTTLDSVSMMYTDNKWRVCIDGSVTEYDTLNDALVTFTKAVYA
jgi:hypothetical protein